MSGMLDQIGWRFVRSTFAYMTTTELRTQYESGATLRELAARHGTTVHAVYTRLKLARAKLRKRNAHMMEVA